MAERPTVTIEVDPWDHLATARAELLDECAESLGLPRRAQSSARAEMEADDAYRRRLALYLAGQAARLD